MEGKKYLFIALIMLFNLHNISAQTDVKTKIYNAYISGNMNSWKSIIDKMEQNKKPNTKFYYQLIEYQYGYIAWCIGNDKDDMAEDYLDLAYDNLEEYRDLGGDKKIADSFESSFLGFEIGINVYRAPFVGKKSKRLAENSIKGNQKHPIALLNYGNMLYYMPSFQGGDKEEGLKYMMRAKFYMEKQKKFVYNNWLYLNLLTTIGNAYKDLGKKDKARKIYEYALIREPDFNYVKNELLPNLNK